LVLKEVIYPEGMRSAVSLSFNAPTLTETYSLLAPAPILVRGDIVMGQGSRIEAGPLGNVGFKAGTVSLFGQVYAPGGTIAVAGANSFPTQTPLASPLPTVYLGPQAVLSTAGKVVLQPDAYGRRIGSVLAGGTISIGGNIVLEAGSLLDVSGTSGILDIAPAYLGLTTLRDPVTGLLKVPLSSGLTTPQFAYETVGTRIDSSGGLIVSGGRPVASVPRSPARQCGRPHRHWGHASRLIGPLLHRRNRSAAQRRKPRGHSDGLALSLLIFCQWSIGRGT